MDSEIFSLTPINLALDGSLDYFVDLYHFTYDQFHNIIQENPSLFHNQDSLINTVIPIILPSFEFLAFKRIRIFTTRVKRIHLTPEHFQRFCFFRANPAFSLELELNLKRIENGLAPYDDRFSKCSVELITFEETFITLDHFLNQFKMVIIRGLRDEIQTSDPTYTFSDARKEVEKRISKRMRMRRDECMLPRRLSAPPTELPLYIFDALNKTGCKQNDHQITAKKYFALHSDGTHIVVLPTHFCRNCNRYMIGRQSLSFFREYCGMFVAQTHYLTPYSFNEWNISGESTLHKLGYNVAESTLSTWERQNLLITILESKQLSFFDIVSTIEQDIRLFEHNYRMRNAVEKWRNDLQFINEYFLSHNSYY